MSFLDISFLDILDIFLVTILFYQVYMLIRGTVAINIFIGIFTVYLLWLLVKALNMQLLGNILGQVGDQRVLDIADTAFFARVALTGPMGVVGID